MGFDGSSAPPSGGAARSGGAGPFDAAVSELYRAPHAEFVATRKRVAAELAARGDVDGAARLVRLVRPTLSAWVVNQLWWHARPTFEAMVANAMRLQDGDSKGGAPYRDALAKLRARACGFLEDSGHTASEAMLRRVMGTLSAIAMGGGFGDDAPGTLTTDCEVGGSDVTVTVRAGRAPGTAADDDDFEDAPSTRRQKVPTVPPRKMITMPPPPPKPKPRVVANGRVHPHVEMHNEDDFQTHVVTEQSLLETALATSRATIESSERERELLQRRLGEVERAIQQAKMIVADVEARLAARGEDE